jgi:hypothetical protein
MPKVLDVKGNKVVGWLPSAGSGRASSTTHETRTGVAQRQIRPESVREWSPSSGTWWPYDHPLSPLGCRSAGTPLILQKDCWITRLELLALFYRSLGDSGRSSIMSALSLGLFGFGLPCGFSRPVRFSVLRPRQAPCPSCVERV